MPHARWAFEVHTVPMNLASQLVLDLGQDSKVQLSTVKDPDSRYEASSPPTALIKSSRTCGQCFVLPQYRRVWLSKV